MSKGDTFENDWLKLIFNATPIANIADNAASSPLTQLFVSLHTTPGPGEAGTAATNECAYGSYARQAVARTSGGFTVTGNSVSPVADISFPSCTSGTETATHFGISVAISGASKLLYSGTLTPNVSIAAGVIPKVLSTSTVTED